MTAPAFDPSEWRGLVVICSGMPWDGPWMVERHLATQLSRWVPVLFVDPPRSMLRAARQDGLVRAARAPRLTRVGPGLAVLRPLAPPGLTRPGLRSLARLMTRRSMRTAVRRLGRDVRAVIIASFDDFFDVCGERVRIFYGTDDLTAAGALLGLSPDWLHQQERAQLARSDQVVAVSEDLVERWRSMGHAVTLIPNGCDAPRYARVLDAPLPDDVVLPPPIAGVVGHLSERIDPSYLEAVADTGQSLLLVGPRHDAFERARLDALIARPNVQWVGAKPSEAMASYLRVMAVGLTPYADSQFNRASFPLKTLEYLAAGLPVVSTDLPASRWLDSELVTIAGTAQQFAAAVVRAAHSTPDETMRRRRMALAAEHSWETRAQQLLPMLGIRVPPGSSRSVSPSGERAS